MGDTPFDGFNWSREGAKRGVKFVTGPYTEQDVYLAEAIEELARKFEEGGKGNVRPPKLLAYRTGVATNEVVTLNDKAGGDFILKGLDLISKVYVQREDLSMTLPREHANAIYDISYRALSPLVWVESPNIYNSRSVMWLIERRALTGEKYERLALFARSIGGTWVPESGE